MRLIKGKRMSFYFHLHRAFVDVTDIRVAADGNRV
jgi:hypothetical protein